MSSPAPEQTPEVTEEIFAELSDAATELRSIGMRALACTVERARDTLLALGALECVGGPR